MEDYSKFVEKQLNPILTGNDKIHACCYGMIGELGEITETFKKHFFQGHPFGEDEKNKVIKEMGDLAFYLVGLCNLMDISLAEVIYLNEQKLKARYPNGFTPEDSINRKD